MIKQTKIERALEWLNEHELITILRLERKLGIPDRVLTKAIAGDRPLPDKYHNPLFEELKKYGFK